MSDDSKPSYDDDIPVLQEVIMPGIPIDELEQSVAASPPNPLPPPVHAEPKPQRVVVDTDQLVPLVEQLAEQIQQELEVKMQEILAQSLEVFIQNTLYQYEEHMKESILSQLLDKLPDMISSATHLEPDDGKQ